MEVSFATGEKNLVEVDSLELGIPFLYQSSFELLNLFCDIHLLLEHPLATNGFSSPR
jgi:hypothetical protein